MDLNLNLKSDSGAFEIAWSDPTDFDLQPEAKNELIPFLKLMDGGFVAFWLNSECSKPIVHMDSEGGYRVVAGSYDEFLNRIFQRNTGIGDIDESEEDLIVRELDVTHLELADLEALNQEFDKWYKKFTALQEPMWSSQTEEIREALHAKASRMINDGLSKVYTLESPWWSMYYRCVVKEGLCETSYLDYGAWYRVPNGYGMDDEMLKLLPFLKSKELETFEVEVACVGIVSVGRSHELVLMPLE